MRVSRIQLTDSIRSELNDNGLAKNQADTVIAVELMLYGCRLADPTINHQDAWAVIPGYNQPVINKLTDLKIIDRLRVLFPEYRYAHFWEEELDKYFIIEKKYRMYENNEGTAIEIEPQRCRKRLSLYRKILIQPLTRVEDDKSFAEPDEFIYQRMVDNEPRTFKGIIPRNLIQEKKSIFPEYIPKKDLSFRLDRDWLSVAQEMDYRLDPSGQTHNYRSRLASFRMRSVYSDEKYFTYTGNQHIGGGLGAGKSTFMMLETYRLVTEKKAKVGFIENSVPQLIERVMELRKLGIHAVPIIGKSDRENHEKRLLLSKLDQFKDVMDIAGKNGKDLSFVSDRCTIKALAGDFDRNNYYPCQSLKQGSNKTKCPLAHTCGVYQEMSTLPEADVWVATSASILHTKIPSAIDPLDRTIYEAMYDLLDVIFIDEADQVQRQFDETFLSEYAVFGKTDDIFESFIRQESQFVTGKYNKYADDSLIRKWKRNLGLLDTVIWGLFERIKRSKPLRKYLQQNKIIWVNKCIDDLVRKIGKDKDEKKKVKDRLWEYAKSPLEKNQYGQLVDQFVEEDNDELRRQLLLQLLLLFGGNERVSQNMQLLSELEFFIYLARLDSGLKFSLMYYPVVQNRLGSGFELTPILTMAREYQPFIKDAMTGILFGYRYERKDGDEIGAFKLIEYSGVGRLLLQEWHNIYENAFGKSGPAVVLMSGTSHSPGSDHYHLEITPNWLIETRNKSPKLHQEFLPVYDPEKDQGISVSGTGEKRHENLRKLAEGLKSRIQVELRYWNDYKRRVLLVVNSYDDVEEVGKVFQNDENWKGKFRLLSRENKHNEIWYPRAKVWQFGDTKSEVLIAPLLSIGRGYNILDHQKKALFGSIFFLIRPYPFPNDMGYIVQVLHANMNSILQRISDKGLQYGEAMKHLRARSRSIFERMYQKPDYWSILSDQERETLSWYLLIPIWQMIGRLLRGGRNARIFYCDSKFADKGNGNMSLFECWTHLMEIHAEDPVFRNLYKPFMESIHQTMKEEVL